MQELNILSLEIQRMPKDPKEDFADPARYPYYCVAATGTHDTSPLRAWWEEDRVLTQKFFNQMMHCGGDAPYFCEPWAAEMIVKEHLKSPAMLTVLPLQDYLAIDGEVRYGGDPADERINIPAIPRHYWRYRMHKTLEELIADTALCEHLRSLMQDAARGV
jgi:4-alpha-glucanotransferase